MSCSAVKFKVGPRDIYCCLLWLFSSAFGVLLLTEGEEKTEEGEVVWDGGDKLLCEHDVLQVGNRFNNLTIA